MYEYSCITGHRTFQILLEPRILRILCGIKYNPASNLRKLRPAVLCAVCRRPSMVLIFCAELGYNYEGIVFYNHHRTQPGTSRIAATNGRSNAY